MKGHAKLIESLVQIMKRPWAFINPLAAEQLTCFISGIVRGYLINCSVTYDEYREANRQAILSRGWEIRSTSPFREMRGIGKPEEEIIQELLKIEMTTWQLLESRENNTSSEMKSQIES